MANVNVKDLLYSVGITNTSSTYDSSTGAKGKMTSTYSGDAWDPDKDQKLIFGHEGAEGKLFYANGILYDIYGQRLREAVTSVGIETGDVSGESLTATTTYTLEDSTNTITSTFRLIGGDTISIGANGSNGFAIDVNYGGSYLTSDSTNGLQVTNVDTTYASPSSTNTSLATVATVFSAIDGLDTTTDVDLVTTTALTTGTGTSVEIKGINETNGIISASTTTSDTFTIGDGKLQLTASGATTGTGTTSDPYVIPTATTNNIFSANATADAGVTLGNEFVLTGTNHIGLRVNTAVSADNNIATMADITAISTRAMHYKGVLNATTDWPSAVEVGDVYIVKTSFLKDGITLEVGDMVVFNTDSDNTKYDVVETNITSGIASGQHAANDGALTPNQIVIASANGIKTSGYTVNAESTVGTTTITGPSTAATNATIPTTANVYDAIQGAVSSVAKTVTKNGKTYSATSNNIDIENAITSVTGETAGSGLSTDNNYIAVEATTGAQDATTGTQGVTLTSKIQKSGVTFTAATYDTTTGAQTAAANLTATQGVLTDSAITAIKSYVDERIEIVWHTLSI